MAGTHSARRLVALSMVVLVACGLIAGCAMLRVVSDSGRADIGTTNIAAPAAPQVHGVSEHDARRPAVSPTSSCDKSAGEVADTSTARRAPHSGGELLPLPAVTDRAAARVDAHHVPTAPSLPDPPPGSRHLLSILRI